MKLVSVLLITLTYYQLNELKVCYIPIYLNFRRRTLQVNDSFPRQSFTLILSNNTGSKLSQCLASYEKSKARSIVILRMLKIT